MTPREPGETQRAYVERVLRDEGRIATFDCLYSLSYADGTRCSITRLAAIIWSLRHEDGLDIVEQAAPGHLAVYMLARQGDAAPAVPAWASEWRCASCGARPGHEPEVLLGDLARSWCPSCAERRTFRRAA